MPDDAREHGVCTEVEVKRGADGYVGSVTSRDGTIDEWAKTLWPTSDPVTQDHMADGLLALGLHQTTTGDALHEADRRRRLR